MKLLNAAGQPGDTHYLYDASGTVNAAAELVLPKAPFRSLLYLCNNSIQAMYFEMDGARATATVVAGKVTAFTVTNGGFGYTYPPSVVVMGGGGQDSNGMNSGIVGAGVPGATSPGRPARGHCLMTGDAVTSIVLDDPGLHYLGVPYVQLVNDPRDPVGCAIPSTGVGLILNPGGSILLNGSCCPTGPVAAYGPGTQAFVCKYMD